MWGPTAFRVLQTKQIVLVHSPGPSRDANCAADFEKWQALWRRTRRNGSGRQMQENRGVYPATSYLLVANVVTLHHMAFKIKYRFLPSVHYILARSNPKRPEFVWGLDMPVTCLNGNSRLRTHEIYKRHLIATSVCLLNFAQPQYLLVIRPPHRTCKFEVFTMCFANALCSVHFSPYANQLLPSKDFPLLPVLTAYNNESSG